MSNFVRSVALHEVENVKRFSIFLLLLITSSWCLARSVDDGLSLTSLSLVVREGVDKYIGVNGALGEYDVSKLYIKIELISKVDYGQVADKAGGSLGVKAYVCENENLETLLSSHQLISGDVDLPRNPETPIALMVKDAEGYLHYSTFIHVLAEAYPKSKGGSGKVIDLRLEPRDICIKIDINSYFDSYSTNSVKVPKARIEEIIEH